MRKQLLLKLISSGTKLNIFIEEPTNSSYKNNLVNYVREFLGGNSPQYMCLDIFELDFQDAKHNGEKLMNSSKVHGLHDE
jgi:hypothetical protein